MLARIVEGIISAYSFLSHVVLLLLPLRRLSVLLVPRYA